MCVCCLACLAFPSSPPTFPANNPPSTTTKQQTPKTPPPAEFAKRLQALARQEDRELLRVFEASFEGPEGTRREADFDAEFFFENARGVLDERDKGGKPVVMAAGADPAGDGGKQ